ncbi:acyltransferase [Vibrio metschnikovii]|uniref:Acyltransferase n=1 Tax=bacterium 19CA03SA04 TaxID=2920698 RepID=A0AAU6SXP4_UNCXX|nr:acyltransferase [Vibrio metschnikovii]
MKVIDNGKNNNFNFSTSAKGGVIKFNGNNNNVDIEDNVTFSGGTLTFGSNNTLKICRNSSLNKFELFVKDNTNVVVGEFVSCTYHTRVYLHEPSEVRIGSRCLIASGVLITTSDMHSIIDVRTGERINPAKNIILEDKVWIAADAKLYGGCHVGSDSIIGACSLVKIRVPNNSVAAGVPAKVIRRDVTWLHETI